jgi:hypothetical protein
MGPGMEVQTFDRLTLAGRRWFFRIVDCGNNEILSGSQPYKSPYQRNETANRLATAIGCPLIPERSHR